MEIVVLFGGRSSEHDISVITAVQAIGAVGAEHRVTPIYVSSEGRWLVGRDFDRLETFSGKVRGREVHFSPGDRCLRLASGRVYRRVDAAVLCLHGMGGEDGTVAGVLELAGVPYSGSNLRASAIGMDKISLKHLLVGCGMPVTKYLGINKYEYSYNLFSITERIKNEFSFPLIVKPSNLGSSIGISLAHDFVELISALSIAFSWDSRVIIEEALTDFIELNCAVMGYGNEYMVSEIEQPLGWTDFLSFEDKYEGGFKGKAERKFPAQISEELRKTVRDLALKTFQAVDASGVARIDFLLKEDKVYVNEINTIPGSLANYLFPNLTFTELINKLIEQAIRMRTDKDSLTYTHARKHLLKSSYPQKLK